MLQSSVRTFFAIFIAFLPFFGLAQASPQFRVNPTNWWVGMKNPHLQLLVYAKDIAEYKPALKPYNGVKLQSSVTVENPNYYFLNLEISPAAKPGTLSVEFTKAGETQTLAYRLEARSGYQPKDINQGDFIYLLLPDRFSNGDPSNDKFKDMADTTSDRNSPWLRHGGDLQGVINHLDYFTDLGVTALWLNPVIENDQPLTNEGGTLRSAYHGYGFTDQYNVDRRLGGNAAYKKLVEEAHKKGIKIIQDAVYNHVGINHWILQDLPMKDWLNQWDDYTNTSFKDQPLLDPHHSKYDRKVSLNGWFMPFLPDLNQKNEYVANYLLQHALWTVEYFKIDSWRIDTYIYNDAKFMNRCNAALLAEYPDMLIFGESWVQSVPNQAAFTKNNIKGLPFKCNLPSTVDFQVFFALNAALNEDYGWDNGVNKLYQTLGQDYLYQQPEDLVTFVDNHDLNRYLSVIGEDIQKYKMGLGWLMTLRGIPSLYYGTEILMKNFKNPTDAEVRKDFPGGWAGDSPNKFTAAGRTPAENDAYNFVKKLAKFRQKSAAIAEGEFTQYLPFGDGMYVYFRHTDKDAVMVISNTGTTTQTLDTQRFQENLKGAAFGTDVISGKRLQLQGLTIQPKEQFILQINKKNDCIEPLNQAFDSGK